MDTNGESKAPLTAAEEKKRKRLLAWKRKQEQQQQQAQQKVQTKVSLSFSLGHSKKKKTQQDSSKQKIKIVNPFDMDGEDGEDDAVDNSSWQGRKRKRPEELMEEQAPSVPTKRAKGSRRWDSVPKVPEKDALDHFMEKLGAGATGMVNIKDGETKEGDGTISVHVGTSMMTTKSNSSKTTSVPVKNVITAEELLEQNRKTEDTGPITPKYGPKDWLSDAPVDTDDEQEEKGRRALIEALTAVPPMAQEYGEKLEYDEGKPVQLAAQVKSEKNRRKQRLEELELQAEEARQLAQAAAEPEVGRYLYSDAAEEGIMEEAERNLEAAKATPDALLVLAELNKKKELKAVDHSEIDYLAFQKNLYIVPRSLSNLTNDEVINRRAKMKVRVRGHGAPAPVSTFEECGLSERILAILTKQGITKPFPVQAQCIPCAMAGRDVIGIAKTGSGKTLAYLLPLLRHILVQPPLGVGESGPIGLIVVPARELAFQIFSVCKSFAKHLGLK